MERKSDGQGMRSIERAVEHVRTRAVLPRVLSRVLRFVDRKVALCAELAVPGSRFGADAGVGGRTGATPALGGVCRPSLVLAPIVAVGVAPGLTSGIGRSAAVFGFERRGGEMPASRSVKETH